MRCALIPAGLLLMLAGYFGPWVDHRVAGLVVTGLDLGEYVKFLPVVQMGEVQLWRPGFYAPLVAASAVALLVAFRRECRFPVWLRLVLLAVAGVAALNLVPPAWTPQRLLEAEFRVQTTSLILLGVALLFSPWLAFVPRPAVMGASVILAAAAIVFPVQGFLAVLPAISELYGFAITPGWGFWLLGVGVVVTIAAVVRSFRHNHRLIQGDSHANWGHEQPPRPSSR